MRERGTSLDRLSPGDMEGWLKGHVDYADRDADRLFRELDALNHILVGLDHVPYNRAKSI